MIDEKGKLGNHTYSYCITLKQLDHAQITDQYRTSIICEQDNF